MGDLTALLLDAKAEYRLQMEEIVTPSIVDTIGTMYGESMREGGSRDGICLFQRKLRDIPGWNASVISNKTREITYMYPYFEDLIAACIIAQLKIMSSIKLSQEKPTVQLKLPTSETFLHEVYIQSAKRVYEDPFMMHTNQSLDVVLGPVVSDAIEKTIRKLIPFKDVLIAYLQNGGDQRTAQDALNNQSDGSSGGSFPRREDDVESSSSDSDDEDENDELCVPYQAPGQSAPQPLHPPQPLAPEPVAEPAFAPPPEVDAYPPPPAPSPPPQPPQPMPMPQPQPQQHEYAAPLLGQEPKRQTLFAGDSTLRQGF